MEDKVIVIDELGRHLGVAHSQLKLEVLVDIWCEESMPNFCLIRLHGIERETFRHGENKI